MSIERTEAKTATNKDATTTFLISINVVQFKKDKVHHHILQQLYLRQYFSLQ